MWVGGNFSLTEETQLVQAGDPPIIKRANQRQALGSRTFLKACNAAVSSIFLKNRRNSFVPYLNLEFTNFSLNFFTLLRRCIQICAFCSLCWWLKSNGPYEANRAQVNWRKGSEEAARHKGVSR